MRSLVTLGESMIMVTPATRERLKDATEFRLEVGGAESNVAGWAAQLGVPAVWAGAVGMDALGNRLIDTLEALGIETIVEINPDRPTGVYFKDPQGEHTEVSYYRDGSAARAASDELVARLPLTRDSVLHLTGVTPALRPAGSRLTWAALHRAETIGATVSFDVNYRAALWSRADAAQELADLSARADVLFVGMDEARALWGLDDAASVRQRFPRVGELVVKDGGVGATLFAGGLTQFVAAPVAEIVEIVGAGDAFAAGYLVAGMRGDNPDESLAEGHRLAALALSTTADIALLEERA